MKSAIFLKTIGLIALIVIILDGSVAYILIDDNKQDARIVNYSGYVRGDTQRLIKLQIVGHYEEADKQIQYIDGLLTGLVKGSRFLSLKRAEDPAYLIEMQKVATGWVILKQKIAATKTNPESVGTLVEESEKFFILTDNAVRAAQNYSEKKINFTENSQLMFLALEVTLLCILGVLVARGLEKDEVLIKELEKFKLAVDGASDHIIITDNEGVVLYVNNATESITGYKASEALGKKAGQLWGQHMDKDFYEGLWKTIKYDKKVFFGRIKNRRKNGEDYVADITISPILNKKGEANFFVGIERDITKEAALDQAKTEFVSLVSHQLRTPLTAISWYTELLLNGDVGKLGKKQMEYLNEVAHGNRRMVELINSLLNISRMEMGTFTVDLQMMDICAVMADTIKMQDSMVTKSKIDLRFVCEKIPKLVLDAKLIGFVFQNLVSNAVKYTPPGGYVKINIVLKGQEVITDIADNGYGIPKKQQGEIFKKFFRADNVRIRNTDGTGLGLYLVKMILDFVGGKIWFESEVDKGSTFHVSIPMSGMTNRSDRKSTTPPINSV